MFIVLTLVALALCCIAYVWYAGVVERAKARARIRRGALLIDVDPPDDYARTHVPGAVNIPIEDLPVRQSDLGPPSRIIVVYARGELRSAHAAHLLRTLGYRSVTSFGAMKHFRRASPP